jgi:hypothetical protein
LGAAEANPEIQYDRVGGIPVEGLDEIVVEADFSMLEVGETQKINGEGVW